MRWLVGSGLIQSYGVNFSCQLEGSKAFWVNESRSQASRYNSEEAHARQKP